MITFPELIQCSVNELIMQKVSKHDIPFIWDNAPLDQLFLVTGNDALDSEELQDDMHLDWTEWYLMLDKEGFTYGLIHLVPEMDETISIHGIGWTQLNKSPRNFVLCWYAMHDYLFSKGLVLIKSYCDSYNSIAINFDFKTGYTFDYCMPSRNPDSMIVHLKIEKGSFENQKLKKKLIFDLFESFDSKTKMIDLKPGRAVSSHNKKMEFTFTLLESFESISDFQSQHYNNKYFYYFKLIPQPALYSILVKDKLKGYVLIAKPGRMKRIVIFYREIDEFSFYLEFIRTFQTRFELEKDDVIMLDGHTDLNEFKNALSVIFKFSGNHQGTSSNFWIV